MEFDAALLALPVKMVLVAAIVVSGSLAAQKAGPFVGGLIATLPISAGPAYIVLALDHGPAFIAESAEGSVSTNAVTVIFAMTYAVLARRGAGGLGSIAGAIGVWLLAAFAIRTMTPPLWFGLLVNVAALCVGVPLARRFSQVAIPVSHGPRPIDLMLRALAVATLVGVLSVVSWHIGAVASGILALFPIVISSILVVTHRAIGGPAAGAVAASSVYGLAGFAAALAAVHLAAVPFGSTAALLIGLAICVAWNGMLFTLRLRRLRRVAAAA